MGSFYVNFSVKGATQAELLEFLRRRELDAFVLPEAGGWCLFAEEGTGGQDTHLIAELGSEVSSDLGKPVICILNHDEDILSIDLFVTGAAVAEYNSCPGYFHEYPDPESLLPRLSGVEELVKLRPGVEVAALEDVLLAENSYTLDVHEHFASLLGLPMASIGFTHQYAVTGEFDDIEGIIRTIG